MVRQHPIIAELKPGSRQMLFFLAGIIFISLPLMRVQARGHSPCDTAAWAAVFREAGVEGTFVILGPEDSACSVFNTRRAHKRYLPASTFKIMNTLIALQNKTVAGIDEVFRWDSIRRGVDAWDRDLSLRQAFRVSAVWVYQELAVRTGRPAIEKWLTTCGYGNCLTGPEINSFWLDGDIAISAVEQAECIRALCHEKLPFDLLVQRQVKEIMLADTAGGKELHAKTGWAARMEQQVGWYVGYVQDRNGFTVFALNIDINKASDTALRTAISRKILDMEGIFPWLPD